MDRDRIIQAILEQLAMHPESEQLRILDDAISHIQKKAEV